MDLSSQTSSRVTAISQQASRESCQCSALTLSFDTAGVGYGVDRDDGDRQNDSGFTLDALIAFGKAKRVICMDGLDLFDMLDRELPLDQVIARKARRAAETGRPLE